MTSSKHIVIDIGQQLLCLIDGTQVIRAFSISTAKNGLGEQTGSECTPRGQHIIRAKIGANCATGTVFVGRRETGEIYSQALADAYPERDWILSRILWLSGCEPGKNRLGAVDTMRRYIYIHGCPDGTPMGAPSSHGCIRMTNADIVDLFELTALGMPVAIVESAQSGEP